MAAGSYLWGMVVATPTSCFSSLPLARLRNEDRVFVYWNLHRNLFSVKALTGPNKGRVVAHKTQLHLTDLSPKISAAGRARVLSERRKNVHAGLAGTYVDAFRGDEVIAEAALDATLYYNPYKHPFFVAYSGGREYEFGSAQAALLLVDEGRPHILVFNAHLGKQLLEAA